MALIDQYFTKADLKRITEACAAAEISTAGEIRVSIFSKRPRKARDMELMDFAQQEFQNLGMQKTRDRTGILLLIILAERKFQILADEGIDARVEQSQWDELAKELTGYFKASNYTDGIEHVVAEMGKILTRWFPIKADDVNELSNEVSIQ